MKHVKASGGHIRMQCRRPGAKTTEVEARMALVCASTDDGRPLTSDTNLIWTVVEWFTSASGSCKSNYDEHQKCSS